jgi:hypothetical protein
MTPEPAPPPGLLGLLVEHGAKSTPFMTKRPALAGSLAGFAAATRNRFAVRIGPANHVPLNLYVAAVGPTSRGKESALRIAEAVAAAGGVKPVAFASAEGLHQTFAAERKDGCDPKTQLLTMDEWGRALQQIKADKAGHQRAVMTKAMECHGLAIGGTLKERKYAKAKDDVPAVRNPFLGALFATTPETLLDAITSIEVVDGSLNRILTVHLEDDPELRPLDAIDNGPLPKRLIDLLARLHMPEVKEVGNGHFVGKTTIRSFKDAEHVTVADQGFLVIKPSPVALLVLDGFRHDAAKLCRADTQLGPLWGRAFEHAARVAGNVALGEACMDRGPLAISQDAAAWSVGFVAWCIEGTARMLRRNLADTDAERTRNRIMRAAIRLRAETLADPPKAPRERGMPDPARQRIVDLHAHGFFSYRAFVRRLTSGGGSGASKARDFKDEIAILVEAEVLGQEVVTWGDPLSPEIRRFYTWIGDQ